MTLPWWERNPDDDRSDDVRHLYGEPQHEVTDGSDPELLYGMPQHESGESTNRFERFWLDCFALRKRTQLQEVAP